MGKRYSRAPSRYGRVDTVTDGARRVVIVCEGSCTEPHYFVAVRQDLRLANIEVDGTSCGSDPLSVVRRALEIYRADPSLDRIVAVIDRDEHETFADAVQMHSHALREGIPFDLIISYPCFEIWYLYHYKYSRSPVVRSGNGSPGYNMVKALREVDEKYEKNARSMWPTLRDRLDTAMVNSERSVRDAEKDGEKNPSTNMFVVMKYLLGLTDQK